jgi:hypothetical protein
VLSARRSRESRHMPCATPLELAGCRLAATSTKVSKILWHSSVAVTGAHYAHLLKEDLVAASRQVRIPVAPRGTGSVVGAASASLRLVDGARACRSFVGSLLS